MILRLLQEIHKLEIVQLEETRMPHPPIQEQISNNHIFLKLLKILLIINNTELHLIFKNRV